MHPTALTKQMRRRGKKREQVDGLKMFSLDGNWKSWRPWQLAQQSFQKRREYGLRFMADVEYCYLVPPCRLTLCCLLCAIMHQIDHFRQVQDPS